MRTIHIKLSFPINMNPHPFCYPFPHESHFNAFSMFFHTPFLHNKT